jgi:hypothetical protein
MTTARLVSAVSAHGPALTGLACLDLPERYDLSGAAAAALFAAFRRSPCPVPNLARLNLDRSLGGPHDAAALAAALPCLRRLTHLDVSGCLKGGAVPLFVETLAGESCLMAACSSPMTHLILSAAGAVAAAARDTRANDASPAPPAAASAAVTLPWTHLRCVDNELGQGQGQGDAARSLGELFPLLPHLEALHLSYNGLGSRGYECKRPLCSSGIRDQRLLLPPPSFLQCTGNSSPPPSRCCLA